VTAGATGAPILVPVAVTVDVILGAWWLAQKTGVYPDGNIIGPGVEGSPWYKSKRQQDREAADEAAQEELPTLKWKKFTPKKQENLADAEKKGIPKEELGPSGKPKVKVVKHPTKKQAKDAARNEGQGNRLKMQPQKKEDHIITQPIKMVVERKARKTFIMSTLRKLERTNE